MFYLLSYPTYRLPCLPIVFILLSLLLSSYPITPTLPLSFLPILFTLLSLLSHYFYLSLSPYPSPSLLLSFLPIPLPLSHSSSSSSLLSHLFPSPVPLNPPLPPSSFLHIPITKSVSPPFLPIPFPRPFPTSSIHSNLSYLILSHPPSLSSPPFLSPSPPPHLHPSSPHPVPPPTANSTSGTVPRQCHLPV